MTLEIVRHRIRVHRRAPRPRPRVRKFGTFYDSAVVEPNEIVVRIPEPSLPWRVIGTTSWGTNVLFQSASLADAQEFFARRAKADKASGAFNLSLRLQRWTGDGWVTEQSANSSVR